MTSLRTAGGIDMEYIKAEWGNNIHEHIRKQAGQYLGGGKMHERDTRLVLSREGMFIADHITSRLFL